MGVYKPGNRRVDVNLEDLFYKINLLKKRYSKIVNIEVNSSF